MIDGGLNTLLLELYACPTDCMRWPGVLDRIRETLRVRSAAVQLLSRAEDRVTVKWVARDSESHADRGHHDPFIAGDQNPRLRCAPPGPSRTGMFMRDRDYFRKGDRELAQLHERLAGLGLGSCLSACVSLSDHEWLVLVLHRDMKDCRDYSPNDEALVATVLPHLSQAISLSGQMEAVRHQNNALHQAVDRMTFGLVLCDADARSAWANCAARRAFSDRDGLWLRQNRLTTASPADTEALRRAIAHVAEAGAGARDSREQCLLLNRVAAASALQVMVVPLQPESCPDLYSRHSELGHSQVLLLFSRASTPPILAPNLVATLFALSPAESRLAIALCQGHTVSDYAAAHGVSVGTARFQLKQVLAKTHAPRQSDLVRRVCTSVVAHALRAEA